MIEWEILSFLHIDVAIHCVLTVLHFHFEKTSAKTIDALSACLSECQSSYSSRFFSHATSYAYSSKMKLQGQTAACIEVEFAPNFKKIWRFLLRLKISSVLGVKFQNCLEIIIHTPKELFASKLPY